MTARQGLVPTPIVDKRGRQTTVHKKPVDGSLSASKAFPAPVTRKSPAQWRKELETLVSGLFPEKYVDYVKGHLAGFTDETVKTIGETAHKIIEQPKFAPLGNYASIIRDVSVLQLPEEIFPFISRSIPHLSDEVSLVALGEMYRNALGSNTEPASEEVMDAHVDAANKYFDMAIKAPYNIEYTYVRNTPLFDFVAKHPDKVDLIFQHYLTYYPERNGYEEFERDLDGLAELSKPIGEGWL